MQLYSLQFVVFLLVALAAYFAVGRVLGKYQWIVLLAASLGFYCAAGWQHIVFILVTATTTWLLGLAFDRLEAASKLARSQVDDRAKRKAIKKRYNTRKRLLLALGLLANFGILAYLKYWDALLGALGAFGLHGAHSASSLLLPLGISFYTFQSMGYLIDIYNAKYQSEGNYARFLLFVSFFPQLIQGPINRYDHLAQQLYEPHRFEAQRAKRAFLLIGFGMLKKYVMADLLIATIGACLDNITASTPGCIVVFGILLYSAQQYGDFSGGIDMVRGVSRLFGVEMAQNFKQPYFSVSLADFWHRWHITLGAWMRDYVFYPLALAKPLRTMGAWLSARVGKHVGRSLPAAIANIVVFFLVGLWHGADAHFILWGLYNGIVIALADLLMPLFKRMNSVTRIERHAMLQRVWRTVRTFVVINIGWYFDRIVNFGDLAQGFYDTFFNFKLGLFLPVLRSYEIVDLDVSLALAGIACAVVVVVSVLAERGVDVGDGVLRLNVVVRYVLYVAAALLILMSFMYASGTGGFIYANF